MFHVELVFSIKLHALALLMPAALFTGRHACARRVSAIALYPARALVIYSELFTEEDTCALMQLNAHSPTLLTPLLLELTYILPARATISRERSKPCCSSFEA